MAVKTSSVNPPANAGLAGAPSRGRRLWSTYSYPLTVFVTSRLLVYLLFAMIAWNHRRPRLSGLSYGAVMSPLDSWDAVWYHWIEAHGYDPAIAHGNLPAFYPLWPAAWHSVSWLPIPIYLAGSLLATALFGVALCLLYRITLGRYDVAMARRTVLFTAFWPLAFVFSMPYSESLFLLASLGAFALTWHGRWWSGSAVGALAVLARPVGVALIPGTGMAHLPRAGLALAGVPPAALDGRGRGWLLPVPGLAHRRCVREPRCRVTRMGAGVRAAAIRGRPGAVGRCALERSSAFACRRLVHASPGAYFGGGRGG